MSHGEERQTSGPIGAADGCGGVATPAEGSGVIERTSQLLIMHVLGDLRQFPKGIELSYFAQGTFVVFIRPGSSNLREMPDRQAATGIDGLCLRCR